MNVRAKWLPCPILLLGWAGGGCGIPKTTGQQIDSGPGGGPVIPVSDDLRAATLSAGGNHTCVIRSDRSLWCWGDDSMGELGDGINPARGTPEPVGNATDWVSIAAGDYYSTLGCLPPVGYPEPSPCGSGTCGIRADGTLWCWGDVATPLTNTNIRANGPTRVGDASDWNRVSTSGRQACGIRLNGTLWCWGGVNISGFGLTESAGTADPEQVGAAADWRDVNVGKGASCGIRRDGTLWCWASSPYETFGAVVIPPPHPQRIGSGVDWISASVGGLSRKACGIRADQSLWCWNWTARQEANRGPPIFATDPELRVGGISNYAVVSVGDALSCAIRSDGALFCWSEGPISPEVAVAPEPIRVGTGTDWTEVSVGGDHTCARRTAGDTLCWGNNFFGQLGRGTTGMAHTPRRVDGKQWTELGAAMGLDTGGALWYWDNDQIRLAPESTFTALADTDRYGCALRSPGITSCWRLDRTLAPPPIAIAIESTAPWRQIAAGYYHGCGIRVDGGLWCWGSNYYGEVGDGTRVDRAAPVRVGDASDWIGVRTRYLHTCAIEAPGTLYCWGDNRAGAIGDGTIVEQHAPVRVGVGIDWTDVVPGFGNTCALRADKTLWCWGEQRSPVPVQVGADADWQQISLGGNFMCGLRSHGKLFCWGSGFAGQLGQGTLSSGVPSQVGTDADWTAVVAGEAHACALKTDGSRWCWGANAHGELGDGTSWSPDPAPVAF